MNSLERQLRESDILLQHALAYARASQEKLIMLYSIMVWLPQLAVKIPE